MTEGPMVRINRDSLPGFPHTGGVAMTADARLCRLILFAMGVLSAVVLGRVAFAQGPAADFGGGQAEFNKNTNKTI